MSNEAARRQASVAGAGVFAAAFHGTDESLPTRIRINTGIDALLDAGWVPPTQRDDELARTAAWQRDARRAFEAVERIADELDNSLADSLTGVAQRLRDALGDRFLTPKNH